MRRAGRGIGRGALHIICVALALFFAIPLLWALVSSVKPINEIFADTTPFHWSAFWPTHGSLHPYAEVLQKGFARALFNTTVVSGLTVVGAIVVNGLAGFAFAKFQFPGKRILFVFTMITFLVPFEAIAIALYQVVAGLGGINTYWALIVPGIPNGLLIFLFRQFFLAIPQEFYDAARVDGASPLQIVRHVYAPLARPAVLTAALVIFITQWEAFLWPLLITRTQNMDVIQLALGQFQTLHFTLWNQLFAASVLAVTVPLLIMLPLQRYYTRAMFDSGLTG